MISIADVTSNLSMCKALALALPRFYKRTGISAKISMVYSKDNEGIEISLGFHPQEPTESEYSMLFEEITDAEKLLLSEYIVNNSTHFENIKQLNYQFKEDMRQIIYKQQQNG